MDIHKPKPVHGLREFLSEILVVVTGIVIALSGEQLVEAIHWQHKVESVEAAIKLELGDDLAFAHYVELFDPCAEKFMDRLQAAVVAGDAGTVARLDAVRDEPFPAMPWSTSTFTAAIGSQVEDHLPEGRLAHYSREFTWIPLEMEYQNKLYDNLAASTTARFGLSRSAETVDRQLATIDRLRADSHGRRGLAEAMLEYGQVTLALKRPPSPKDNTVAAEAKACEMHIDAISTVAKVGPKIKP